MSAEPTFGPADEAAIAAVTEAAEAIANGSQDWSEYAKVFYAEDAVFMPPNTKAVHGRAAIATFIRDNYPKITALAFSTVQMEGVGDLAYVYGRYHIEMTTSGGPEVDDGKFVEIWKRDSNEGWKNYLDIFNSDLVGP